MSVSVSALRAHSMNALWSLASETAPATWPSLDPAARKMTGSTSSTKRHRSLQRIASRTSVLSASVTASSQPSSEESVQKTLRYTGRSSRA